MQYIVCMKFCVFFSLLFAAMLATAQTPDTAKHDPDPDSLSLAKIAADVAGNLQGHAMNGYLAIYIDQKTWSAGLEDGDLGPFVRLKAAKPDRSVVCIFAQKKDSATCVYFDAGTAFGVASLKAGSGGQIDTSNIASAYKDISKDMLKKRDDNL